MYQSILVLFNFAWFLYFVQLTFQGLYAHEFEYIFKSIHRRCSIRKVFLKILQNSQENTCTRVLFLIKLQAEACNFIKKETLAQVFSCEFCEIFKNTFFTGHLRATASVFYENCDVSENDCWLICDKSTENCDVRIVTSATQPEWSYNNLHHKEKVIFSVKTIYETFNLKGVFSLLEMKDQLQRNIQYSKQMQYLSE